MFLSLPTFKTYEGPQKCFCLHGLYLPVFTILKIKVDAFADATHSHNYLMGFLIFFFKIS